MFLSTVLPSTGNYCVAISRGSGFIHRFFDNVDAVNTYALKQDAKGQTVYVAQATYTDEAVENNEYNRKTGTKSGDPDWRKVRTITNTLYLRSFFVDIDCGEGKPYPTQREGAKALKDMVEDAKLPMPAVVSSGNGLYAYWPMTTDLQLDQWRSVANLLKQVFPFFGLDADPLPTANAAVVLRPPGTTNRKKGRPERTVALLGQTVPTFKFEEFAAQVSKAAKRAGAKNTVVAPPKEQDVWADFEVYQDIPSDAHQIAARCRQVGNFEALRGNVPEPMWYAAIGLLRHADDSHALIHEWSSGHPAYTVADTDQKIEQHKASGVGPTTCAHFGSLDAKLCIGCTYKNKIKSPIVLGRPEPEAIDTEGEEEEAPPAPFTRAKDGLYVQDGDIHFKFYDRDLYPVRIAYDTSLGYEVLTLRHHLPHDGWHEITFRTALVNDPRGLLTALWDNHVHVSGKKEKSLMCAYIEGYAKHLQRKRSLSRLMGQMGWTTLKDKPAFILGKKVFYSDGTIEDAALANNIPDAAKAFCSKGDLGLWSSLTDVFNEEGTEGYAFALLAGAFGAPLMKFTGYEGAMVSLVGKSGIGKTLLTRWIQSTYGIQDQLMMLRDDTRNSLVARLGVYGSLPLTIDEITNIEAHELSDLVYRITQGRDKARLSRGAVERPNINQWNTLAVVSSNTSLAEKLSTLKADASAEMNRVFEYELSAHPALDRNVCTAIFRTITDNYGYAGEAFIHHIVQHTDEHQQKMDELTTYIEDKAGVSSQDRFWCAIIAAAIYGGMLAKKLNLIHFNVSSVLKWAVGTLQVLKAERGDMAVDAVQWLGLFLDDHANNRIVLDVGPDPRASRMVYQMPHGPLHWRHEQDRGRLFISRSEIKRDLAKRHASYRTFMNELLAKRILVTSNKRKVLGAGTNVAGGQHPCWEIDVNNPALGHVAVQLVEQAKTDALLHEVK